MSKVLLFVPYEEKEYAKTLDAKYDSNLKSWYCNDDKKECIDKWGKRYEKKFNMIKKKNINY